MWSPKAIQSTQTTIVVEQRLQIPTYVIKCVATVAPVATPRKIFQEPLPSEQRQQLRLSFYPISYSSLVSAGEASAHFVHDVR